MLNNMDEDEAWAMMIIFTAICAVLLAIQFLISLVGGIVNFLLILITLITLYAVLAYRKSRSKK